MSQNHKKSLSQVSLLISVVLLALKFYAYHMTASKAVLSDALESIVNVVAGLVTMYVLIISLRPADEDHPYGHGKVESMAATFEGGAILFAGILILVESLQSLYHGMVVRELNLGMAIVVVAGMINGVWGKYLVSVAKKIQSEALHSSGVHLLTDAYTSLGLLVGLVLVKITGINQIDAITAIIFGSLLIYSGGKILWESMHTLLDGHHDETINQLALLFEKHARVGMINVHYTRVIRSGAHHHIDCHMVLPAFWSIKEAHHFAHQMEESVMQDYHVGGELHVHLDPCKPIHCRTCELELCPIRTEKFVQRNPITAKALMEKMGEA